MRPFSYARAADADAAIAAVRERADGAFLAGGTTEVDLVRQNVLRPGLLVDINDLPLTGIEDLPGGGLRVGALARMSDVARAPGVRERFPVISQALLLGASAQLRNMASMGGNLCQRVRCSYFRDAASPCNKRDPGSGCAALDGFNRGHAILGTSDKCIATHPSDVAVALVALDAVVHTRGPAGERAIGIDDFFLLPGDTPEREHPLEHGGLITAIEVPATPVARRSVYLKFRDRESYEFALASVAAAVRIEDGAVAEVRLALGGVGTKPWRARRAEASLLGQPATGASFAEAARQELATAAPRPLNAFKVELAQRAIVRALTTLTERRGAMSGAIGQQVSRVDGPLKVTGTARYSGEITLPGLAYAQIVGAEVASGRITIDTSQAERAQGVAGILTHHNTPKVNQVPLVPSLLGGPAPGETFFPMQDDVIHYAGQPVAVVVADTLEQAQYAATLVRVSYAEAPSVTTIDQGRGDAYEPERIFGGLIPGSVRRGNVQDGLAAADLRIDASFRFAANHHNPIETLTTMAAWDGDQLTLYDSCQGIKAVQVTVAALLGLSLSKVRVLTRYVGGAFGAKAMVWPHVTLTALAAQHVRRPVRLTMPRGQMFTSCGHREEQEQHIQLGATSAGKLTAIRHHKISVTSPFDDWAEPAFGAASAAVCQPCLRGRAPAGPGQHDDTDVHPRTGRGGGRVHPRVRDG